MQGIRELVLDHARDALPMLRIGKPVRPVGDERPGTNMRNPCREGVDIAFGAVRLLHLPGEPIIRNSTLPRRENQRGWSPVPRGWLARSCGNPGPDRLPIAVSPRRVSLPSARMSSSRAACSSTRMSSATGARVSPCSVGGNASEACRAPIEEKSRSEFRHCSNFSGSKLWLSSRCTISSSNGAQRPVVPKVPSRVARPARPAICASSAGLRCRN